MELNEVKSIGLSALYDAVDRNALHDAICSVEELLKEKWLNDANRRALTGLHFQLRVKLFALIYLSEGYCSEDREKLAEELSAMYIFADENNAERMKALAVRLQLYFNEVGQIMRDTDRQAARLRADDWSWVTRDLREIREIEAFFAERIGQVRALSEEPPFGDYAFPDIREMLRKDLEEVRDFAVHTADQMEIEGSRSLLEELLIPVEQEFLSCEYCPVIAESDYAYAGTVVISTPFADELELFAVCYGKKTGTSVAVLDVARLNGRNEGIPEILFGAVAKKGEHLLLRGMDRYRGDRRHLLARALVFGKTSGKKGVHYGRAGRSKALSGMLGVYPHRRIHDAYGCRRLVFDLAGIWGIDRSAGGARNALRYSRERQGKDLSALCGLCGVKPCGVRLCQGTRLAGGGETGQRIASWGRCLLSCGAPNAIPAA